LSTTQIRPLRADAQRNRDLLLEIAVRAFAQDGPDATLESIAAEAGVGIGTLYRNFPTRQALIEAAYRSELARLCAGVPELLRTVPADAALRTWMDRFIDYLATKRGMADALRTVIASGGNPYAQSRESLIEAVGVLLKRRQAPRRHDRHQWDLPGRGRARTSRSGRPAARPAYGRPALSLARRANRHLLSIRAVALSRMPIRTGREPMRRWPPITFPSVTTSQGRHAAFGSLKRLSR
jgi:AcrR family transcriptional regulator